MADDGNPGLTVFLIRLIYSLTQNSRDFNHGTNAQSGTSLYIWDRLYFGNLISFMS